MTLAEIRQSVRGKLDDTQYDQTSIDEAANWFVSEVFNNNRIRLMEESDTLQVGANATTTAFPEDMQTLIAMSVTVPQVYDLMPSYVQYGDFTKEYPNYATANAQPARQWTDFGNAIRFAAPVRASTTIAIDYLRRPAKMESDADECEIPDAYSKMVTIGTLAEVMERNEDYAEAAQERDKLEPLLTAFIRNEARGQIKIGPTIIRTNRRGGRAGGYNVARDF